MTDSRSGAVIIVRYDYDCQNREEWHADSAYQSKSPMSVLRKFIGILESDTKSIKAKFYVGKGLCGYLLSWKTSQDLLQIVQPVTLNK